MTVQGGGLDKSRFRGLMAHCTECGEVTEAVEDLFCAACRATRTPIELGREAGHRRQIGWRLAGLHSRPQ